MYWRDYSGNILNAGDMVEDMRRREIGKVVFQNGLPYSMVCKRFSPSTLGYEYVDPKGPAEAYLRSLVDKHTKIWWALHGYRLMDVDLLKRAEKVPRTPWQIGAVRFDAPVPWE